MVLGLAAVLLTALATYAAAAWAFVLLPPSPPAAVTAAAGPPPIEAYVTSNGVHTDLVLPLRAGGIDWTQVFDPAHFGTLPADAAFVAIGWGDREFYLNTPRWRDLTLGRALGAVSGTGRSLLHVTWLRRADLGARTWHLPLSPEQADRLRAHVLRTLAPGPDGRAVAVPGHYGAADAFFEARGAYDLFTTCNTWTGDALRQAGVPMSRWTPFDWNVTWHLTPLARGAPPPGTALPASPQLHSPPPPRG